MENAKNTKNTKKMFDREQSIYTARPNTKEAVGWW
jgi:hypothetical protein